MKTMFKKEEVLENFTRSDNANELNPHYLEFVGSLIKYFIQEIDQVRLISKSDISQVSFQLTSFLTFNNLSRFI